MKTTLRSLISLVALLGATTSIAYADCNKPFGAERRVCDISSYQVISWLGEPADIDAKGGTNTHDILLFTVDGAGNEIRLVELSFWERNWSDIPPNGHNNGASHPDNYTINATHLQFRGVLDQLENGERPRFIVKQTGNDIRANIKASVERLQ